MYVRVARFARHYGRSPGEFAPEAVHAYQLHLLDTGASWSRFNQAVSALRFLYRITLARPWPAEHIPYGKKRRSLPVVLSQDEVLRLTSIGFLGILHTCAGDPDGCPTPRRRAEPWAWAGLAGVVCVGGSW